MDGQEDGRGPKPKCDVTLSKVGSQFTYRNASNKGPGAYLIYKLLGGCLFEDGRLFEGALI